MYYNTCTINYILDKNNIDKRIVNEIISDNYDFYKLFVTRKKLQIGGSDIRKFTYGGKVYELDYVYDADRHIYSLSPKGVINRTCFLIIIPDNENYVYIDNISSYEDCPHVGHLRNGRGSHLFKVVLAFIDSIKNDYKLKYIQLKDNSTLLCKNKGKIELSSLYILTQGESWYGKYGFIPFDVDKRDLHFENYVNYKVNSKLVDALRVSCTDLQDLILKSARLNNNTRLTDDKIKKLFKIYDNKSIKEFFKMFLSNYDLTCNIFYDIYKDFMRKNDIINLHGISYFKTLL